MKKRTTILFRIIYIFILIVIVLVVVFANINRMRGRLSVTVNGKEYLPDSLECIYIDKGTKEKITYKNKSSSVWFKNSGSAYGMYEYSFDINNKEVDIRPKIFVFKTNWWKIKNMDINFNIYKDNTTWNADIAVNVHGYTYNKTFYDIENDVIEYRVE